MTTDNYIYLPAEIIVVDHQEVLLMNSEVRSQAGTSRGTWIRSTGRFRYGMRLTDLLVIPSRCEVDS